MSEYVQRVCRCCNAALIFWPKAGIASGRVGEKRIPRCDECRRYCPANPGSCNRAVSA